MLQRLKLFWRDDCGAVIAPEFLFMATILVLAIIVGLVSLRAAVVTEMAELANAYLSLSQGYSFGGLSGCFELEGAEVIDTPSTLAQPTCTPPTGTSMIDQMPGS